jgi:hypothetical protein
MPRDPQGHAGLLAVRESVARAVPAQHRLVLMDSGAEERHTTQLHQVLEIVAGRITASEDRVNVSLGTELLTGRQVLVPRSPAQGCPRSVLLDPVDHGSRKGRSTRNPVRTWHSHWTEEGTR